MSRIMPAPGSSASTQEQPVKIQVGGDVAATEGQPVEDEEYAGRQASVHPPERACLDS